MSENNKNNISITHGYQPNIELRGYQPTQSIVTGGYQPASSKKASLPPSTGSPVQKPSTKS